MNHARNRHYANTQGTMRPTTRSTLLPINVTEQRRMMDQLELSPTYRARMEQLLKEVR